MPHSGDDCSYPFWEKELTLTSVVGGPTGCARRFNNGTPEYRKSPSGDQAIVIYSDEHGEAMTQYVPGWDFYFDQLIAANPQIITPGNGCDLRDIYPLGTAQIKATARYPGQRRRSTSTRPRTRSPRRSTTTSRRKSRCVRKGNSGADLLSWICTATAIDIDNTALNDENVCFTAPDAEGIKAYPSGTASTTDALGRICVMTSWSGEAAIEIFGKVLEAERAGERRLHRREDQALDDGRPLVLPVADDDDDHDDDHADDDHHDAARRRRRRGRRRRRRPATTTTPAATTTTTPITTTTTTPTTTPPAGRAEDRDRPDSGRQGRQAPDDEDHALPERARQRDAEDGQDRSAAHQEEREDAAPGAARDQDQRAHPGPTS